MEKYSVRDSKGRVVHLYEKTSLLLTIAAALSALTFLAAAAGGSMILLRGAEAKGSVLLAASILPLIYTFVFNHLRRKGDMDVDHAELPTINGGVVEVRVKTSIWITLAYALTILFILLALGATAYGAYLLYTGSSVKVLAAGLGGLIAGLIYASVLRFLRTKLDFPGSRALVRSLEGYVLELYKSRSIWITLAMIFTLLAAIGLLGLGAALANTHSIAAPGKLVAAKLNRGITTYYEASSLIVAGLTLLINVAVLNFLSIKAHIKTAEHPEPSRNPRKNNTRHYTSEEYLYGEEIEEEESIEEEPEEE